MPVDPILVQNLVQNLQALAEVESADELRQVLPALALHLPITATCPEVPYFPIAPPTYAPPDQWPSLLSSFSFPDGAVQRLLKDGRFMPLDLEMFDEQTSGQSFFEPLTRERHVLLDAEYGISPFKEDSPVWSNVAFTRLAVERLQPQYPEIAASRTRYLSLGAVRMARLMSEINGRTSPDMVTTVSVSHRQEIDNFLDHLQRQLGLYQLWFRGQAEDHLLPNLQTEAQAGICPWRSLQDSSFIPMLYRELPKRLSDPKAYVAYCREYALYSMFLHADLSLVDYTSRNPGDAAEEMLKGGWSETLFQPTFTTLADGSIEMYMRSADADPRFSPTVDRIRDYHPIFHGLQQVFFMQHYGLASNVLDITRSVDVALFFAQNEVDGKSIRAVDWTKKKPVLYLLLLRPDVDLFLNSEALSGHYGLLRPQRQNCGVLFGASFINRNDYARFIALKIVLERPIEHTGDPEELIPPPSEDGFLARLIEFADRNALEQIRPWVYDASAAR